MKENTKEPTVVMRRLLAEAQTDSLRKLGLSKGFEHAESVDQAMADLEALRFIYREALIHEAHSARVGQVMADIQTLASLLGSFGCKCLTDAQQKNIRTRIKSWHHDSRLWIQNLPHSRSLQDLPREAGESQEDRITAIKQLWLEAGGGFFGPHHSSRPPTRQGLPQHLRLPSPMLPESYIWDLMDRSPSAIPGDGDLPRWTCDPEVTIKLLDVAREVLLREVGGEDKGGNTTMAQRQRRSSLKDAFAFSCLQIYERTAGPKSACQRARRAWDDKRSPFEHFVRVVHEWAVGPMAPRGWALGPDPIRKAIATQRAWQKLFKTVNCMDEHEFKKLSFESKEDAIRTLGQNAAQRLKPPSVPLI